MSKKRKEKPTVGHVYALIDPNTLQVRYVGKTIKESIYSRYAEHTKDARAGGRWYVHRWLRKINFKAQVKLIETVVIDQLWQAERKWIKYYRDHGYPLTNLTDGGEGTSGYSHTASFKKRMSRIMGKKVRKYYENRPGPRSGVKLTQQEKKALSLAHIGNKVTAATRKKISKTMKAMKIKRVISEKQKKQIAKTLKLFNKVNGTARYGVKKTKKQKKRMSILKIKYYKTHKGPMTGHKHTRKTRLLLRESASLQPRKYGKFA